MKKSQTYTQTVVNELYQAIVTGEIMPGTKLVVAHLKDQYHVSLSVVREALTQLVAQELVVAVPNIGFRVATVSVADVDLLRDARIVNEEAAMRLAIPKLTTDDEVKLKQDLAVLDATPLRRDDGTLNFAWLQAHRTFHMTLINACGNRFLINICQRLWNQSELYRSQSILTAQTRPIIKEHHQLLAAILDRDCALAISIHRHHLEETTAVLDK